MRSVSTILLRYSGRRILFQYTFEGGSHMTVIVDGDVDTKDAMWAIRELMAQKEIEIASIDSADQSEGPTK